MPLHLKPHLIDAPPDLVEAIGEDNWTALNKIALKPKQMRSLEFVANGDPTKLAFLRNVVLIENRGWGHARMDAKSHAGAVGPFQFIPSTARLFKLDPADRTDFYKSAVAAGQYYENINQRFKGNLDAMYADYNGGTEASQAVLKGRLPPTKETRDYINMARILHSTP